MAFKSLFESDQVRRIGRVRQLPQFEGRNPIRQHHLNGQLGALDCQTAPRREHFVKQGHPLATQDHFDVLVKI